jgi:hypothetical protein
MRRRITELLLTLCGCVLLVFGGSLGYAQHQRGPEPIVDISGARTDHVPPNIREQRSKRYNSGQGEPMVEPDENDQYTINTLSYQNGLPPLPVAQSAAIVVGTAEHVQAFLSQQKDHVYTEAHVKVEKLLFSRSTVTIKVGEFVDVQRGGGAARFPFGKVRHFGVQGQGLPRAGDRYVFFLNTFRNSDAYYIVTAYDFTGGTAEPLDDSGSSRGAENRFVKYRGVSESDFLKIIAEALKGGSQ